MRAGQARPGQPAPGWPRPGQLGLAVLGRLARAARLAARRPALGRPRYAPDLEQLARHFTRELRDAATHAQAVSEEAAGDLRSILDDALDRIKAEVFGAKSGTDRRGPAESPPPSSSHLSHRRPTKTADPRSGRKPGRSGPVGGQG